MRACACARRRGGARARVREAEIISPAGSGGSLLLSAGEFGRIFVMMCMPLVGEPYCRSGSNVMPTPAQQTLVTARQQLPARHRQRRRLGPAWLARVQPGPRAAHARCRAADRGTGGHARKLAHMRQPPLSAHPGAPSLSRAPPRRTCRAAEHGSCELLKRDRGHWAWRQGAAHGRHGTRGGPGGNKTRRHRSPRCRASPALTCHRAALALPLLCTQAHTSNTGLKEERLVRSSWICGVRALLVSKGGGRVRGRRGTCFGGRRCGRARSMPTCPCTGGGSPAATRRAAPGRRATPALSRNPAPNRSGGCCGADCGTCTRQR